MGNKSRVPNHQPVYNPSKFPNCALDVKECRQVPMSIGIHCAGTFFAKDHHGLSVLHLSVVCMDDTAGLLMETLSWLILSILKPTFIPGPQRRVSQKSKNSYEANRDHPLELRGTPFSKQTWTRTRWGPEEPCLKVFAPPPVLSKCVASWTWYPCRSQQQKKRCYSLVN